MKNLIVGTLVVLSLAACNTTLQRPDYCVGKPSLIYDVAEKSHIDPAAVSQLLVFADFAALKRNVYLPDQARSAIATMRNLLDTTPTYAAVVQLAGNWISYLNNYAGALVVVMPVFLTDLNQPLPISECDRKLLLAHLERQEAMLNLMFKQSDEPVIAHPAKQDIVLYTP
jgi:hypothetical protein